MIRSAQFIALCFALSLAWPCWGAGLRDSFVFDGWQGPPLRVFTGLPETPDRNLPVVFVMHGVGRNAEEYRDQWLDLADLHRFLLVVPEFSDADFPGSASYQQGGVRDVGGAPRPRTSWAFSAIEPLFDAARSRYAVDSERYALYGHSGGAQFVHRFVFHAPEARVSRIVTANAGWYTLPDRDVAWPYGLAGSRVLPADVARALGMPVVILLGDRDTDPAHPSLRTTPEALAQGPHRFARGFAFFESGRLAAEHLGVPFEWHLVTVPGADHDNRKMAPAAIPYLLH